MTYGKRLARALSSAGKTRKHLADAIGVTPQAIGMVINSPTNKLSFENNLKAAEFLRVSPSWLSTGEDAPAAPEPIAYIGPSPMARELALVFDMIPESRILLRSKAFALATSAIAAVLQGDEVALSVVPSPKKAP